MKNQASSQNNTAAVPDRLLYSLEETAQLLSLSRLTVVRMAYKGTLTTKKIGRRRLVPKTSIEKLIRESVG
jgi:excisionase family DNA binding protein